jgi:hypothetical protein
MCGFRTKCALASAVPRRGSGRAKEHGRASCGSSNPNRPTSLVPYVRNGMQLSAWYYRTPIPYANTKTMALHLQEVSQAIPPGRRALAILDQAV